MAKKVVSIRLEAESVEALDAYASAHDLSRAEAVEVAIKSLDHEDAPGTSQKPPEVPEDAERPETHAEDHRAVVEVLRASNADLRQEVSRLWLQISEKDQQIRSLQGIADHAQQLHAAEVTRALPPTGPRPSFWSWLTGRRKGE